MTLVSREAPNFLSSAVMEDGKIIDNFNFKNYLNKNICVLFFWPMNFTFVCPTEIIFLNKKYNEFKIRKTKIVGVSCDSEFSHKFWQETDIKNGGIGKINFPMISDKKREIIKFYNIEHSYIGVPLRATFIIDKLNIIRFEIVHDLEFGRNIDEILRLVDSIKYNEKNKNLCQVNWQKGDKGIDINIK